MPRPRSCLLFARPSSSSWLVVLALAWLCLFAPSVLAVAPPAETEKPLTSLVRLPKVAHPVRYAADLQLVPTADSFTGRIDIDLQIEEPTQVLWLDKGADLVLQQVSLRLGPAEGTAELVGKPQQVGKDVVQLHFERRLPVGPARLRLTYQGKLPMSEGVGLYREKDGNDLYIYSDFEPIDARLAFPCFDEPIYKVSWQLTLHVRREHLAVSNTPVASEADEPGGMKRVTFQPTPPLPSYLVALAVGPFGIVDAGRGGQNQTPLRILTLRGHEAEGRYAAQVTGPLLQQLEQYFGSPYPYAKLDQIAVPNRPGAMENPGLITYGQRLLQLNAADETLQRRRLLAKVCAHELAHQWTGNLVTMAFWDDLWLNESLADFIESKIISKWQPTWEESIERTASRLFAMGADSLVSARKIRQPITSNDDIVNAFDRITYAKGKAVMAMFESFVSEPVLQRGLQRYLKAHAFGNATAQDLIKAISEELLQTAQTAPQSSQPDAARDLSKRAAQLPQAMATFLDQPGVPQVTLRLSCDGAPRLQLSQQRSFPLGSVGGEPLLYQVPVCLRYRVAPSPEQTFCTLLTQKEAQLELPGATRCPEYVLGNAGAVGYYRVRYEGELLTKLAPLLTGASSSLSESEKVSLLGDLRAGMVDGSLPAAQALQLVEPLAAEPSRHVLAEMLRLLWLIRDALAPEQLPAYERMQTSLFGARLAALGLVARPTDDDNTKLVRGQLMYQVLVEGHDRAQNRAAQELLTAHLRQKKRLDPETADQLLSTAVPHGDRALWTLLHEAAKAEKDRSRRGQLLSALGSFREPQLARASLDLILSGEFPTIETLTLLYGPQSGPLTRQLPFEFLKRSFDALAAKLPKELPAKLSGVAAALCTPALRTEAEQFFKSRTTRYTGGPRLLSQSLERISLCSAFVQAQKASVTTYLKKFQ